MFWIDFQNFDFKNFNLNFVDSLKFNEKMDDVTEFDSKNINFHQFNNHWYYSIMVKFVKFEKIFYAN